MNTSLVNNFRNCESQRFPIHWQKVFKRDYFSSAYTYTMSYVYTKNKHCKISSLCLSSASKRARVYWRKSDIWSGRKSVFKLYISALGNRCDHVLSLNQLSIRIYSTRDNCTFGRNISAKRLHDIHTFIYILLRACSRARRKASGPSFVRSIPGARKCFIGPTNLCKRSILIFDILSFLCSAECACMFVYGHRDSSSNLHHHHCQRLRTIYCRCVWNRWSTVWPYRISINSGNARIPTFSCPSIAEYKWTSILLEACFTTAMREREANSNNRTVPFVPESIRHSSRVKSRANFCTNLLYADQYF